MPNPTDVIELEGFFLNARNEIVNPDRYVASSKYFWDKWVPELGPNLTVLIMQLRKYCFYNRSTGEKRDTVRLSLENIAQECGLSKATIKRELATPISKQFIKTSFNYKYHEITKKKVRASNTYQVVLDDPIHLTDRDKLLEIKEKRKAVSAANTILDDLKLNLTSRSKNPTDNPAPKAQFEPHIYEAQIEPVSTNVSTSLNTLNVNVQGNNVQKPEDQKPLTPKEASLVEKILAVTKDRKSEPFYRIIARHCSEASIDKAIEDIKTYLTSGRVVKNPGALFTSRIKSYDRYFKQVSRNN